MSLRRTIIVLIVACLPVFFSSPTALAKDVEKEVHKHLFKKLYKDGGVTFFTNTPFRKPGPLLVVSNVYSTSFIRESLGCGTNRQCKRESETYKKILGDLHNAVPEKSSVAFKLKTSSYGILDESQAPDDDGLRSSMGVVDPIDEHKGDIARIIFYMHKTYDLPLLGNIADLTRWNEIDPPSEEEKRRNEQIEAIQGTRNPFVDSPALVSEIEG